MTYTFPYLEPGEYEVSVAGQPPQRVRVDPGQVTNVHLGAPERWEIRLLRREAGLRGEMLLWDIESKRRVNAWTDAEGRCVSRVAPGRYVPYEVWARGSLRRVPTPARSFRNPSCALGAARRRARF